MPQPQQKIYTEDDYYRTPEDVRVELIDGRFYDMASPGRAHQKILGELFRRISNYIAGEGGSCEVYPAPFAVRLFDDAENIVEPDISVICDPGKLTERGCSGAPDWIIEIVSPSNPGHDYVKKLNLYVDAGVREYWIVDPQSRKVSVYCLERKEFPSRIYSFTDKIRANIFGDLYIDFAELDLS